MTGATGNVGRELVSVLLARGARVRALTRRPAAAGLPAAVEVVPGSTSDTAAMTVALSGADGVFLNPVGDVRPVIAALQGVPVRRVVLLSSVCVGTRHDLVLAGRLRDTEDQVRSARPDVVALRPNQFMSNTLWWRSMIEAGTVSAPFADIALPAIAGEDIAAVAAEALLRDTLTGQSPLLTGGEAITARQRVAVLAEVLDRPLAFHEQTEEEFRAARPDLPGANLDYQVAMTGSPSPAEQEVSDAVAGVTGQDPMTFREWASRHRDRLAHRHDGRSGPEQDVVRRR